MATTLSLLYGAGGGERLFYANAFSLSDAKPDSAPVGIALLFAVPLLQMIGGSRIPTAIRTVIAAVSTAMAAVLLEYSALSWPTNSPPAAIELFMKGNAIVLSFAILLAMLSARAIRLSYPTPPLSLQAVGSPDPTMRLSIGWEQE